MRERERTCFSFYTLPFNHQSLLLGGIHLKTVPNSSLQGLDGNKKIGKDPTSFHVGPT